MTTTWRRALDTKGRLFTIARRGGASYLYFPDVEGDAFAFASGGGPKTHPGRIPVRTWRSDFSTEEALAGQKAWCGIVAEEVAATATPGRYFPRIHRGPEHPPVDIPARTATMRAARSLFARLRDVSQVVEPTRAHDMVFGHELRQLLILACTEVESSWRAVLTANDYSSASGRWSTNDYVKLLGPMKLDDYVVTLASHPGYGEVAPFRGWDPANPTRSLVWYDAYNQTKHNREEALDWATMAAAIQAMAAVHVMTVAQFGFNEVERGHFHADAFNFERSPAWIADAYIRPLLMPDQPLMEGERYVEWPQGWEKAACRL